MKAPRFGKSQPLFAKVAIFVLSCTCIVLPHYCTFAEEFVMLTSTSKALALPSGRIAVLQYNSGWFLKVMFQGAEPFVTEAKPGLTIAGPVSLSLTSSIPNALGFETYSSAIQGHAVFRIADSTGIVSATSGRQVVNVPRGKVATLLYKSGWFFKVTLPDGTSFVTLETDGFMVLGNSSITLTNKTEDGKHSSFLKGGFATFRLDTLPSTNAVNASLAPPSNLRIVGQ